MDSKNIEERFSLVYFLSGVVAGLVGVDSLLWGTAMVVWKIFSNSQNWIRLWQPKPRIRAGQGDTVFQSQMDNLMAFAGWWFGYFVRIALLTITEFVMVRWKERSSKRIVPTPETRKIDNEEIEVLTPSPPSKISKNT